MNGGVPGYTIAQGLDRLREILPWLKPDAVVLMFGVLNEQFPAAKFSDEEWIRIRGTSGQEAVGLRRLRLWQFLVRLRSGVRRSFRPGNLDELVREGFRVLGEDGEPAFGRRVPLERFGPLLDEACGAAEAAGSRAVVVVPPISPGGGTILLGERNLWRRDLYERIAEECRRVGGRAGRGLFDAREVFPPQGSEPLFTDEFHPSDAGHALLARGIAEALAPDSGRVK